MFQMTQLDNNYKQQIKMTLDDNSDVTFYFEYRPNQLGWFFGFTYGDVTYKNVRLTTTYNVLRAYRNWLPFGLMCITPDKEEPMDLDDFSTGYATVYLLNKSDVEYIEGNYYAKVSA